MPRPRSLSQLLLFVIAALIVSTGIPLAHSQTLASTSSFSGSVSDSSGARVANANVTLSSPEKGITRVFKTDAEGSFSFSLLPAATYTLTVQASGFKTLKQEGITLEVGQSARQSVALTIGSTEQIEVTAVALYSRRTMPT
jgi:Carboxypeptidase regulatory-like domain